MEEIQEVICDTIWALHEAGWKQYIDCNNLTIKLVKNHKSYVFRLDSYGELCLESCKSVTLEDLEEIKEIFGKLINEVNLFDYFTEYVDSLKHFCFLKNYLNLLIKVL